MCKPQQRNVVDVTLAAPDSRIENDAVVKGRILSFSRQSGLHVNFAGCSYRGFVQITDVDDAFDAATTGNYRPDAYIWCYVLDATHRKKLVLSTRKSRLVHVYVVSFVLVHVVVRSSPVAVRSSPVAVRSSPVAVRSSPVARGFRRLMADSNFAFLSSLLYYMVA